MEYLFIPIPVNGKEKKIPILTSLHLSLFSRIKAHGRIDLKNNPDASQALDDLVEIGWLRRVH